MVGFLLDGRLRGPGSRALIDDIARGLAGDGVQTHRIELFPSPSRSRRIALSIHRSDNWVRRDAVPAPEPPPAAWLDVEPSADALGLLAGEVCQTIESEGIESLHAIGLGLAGRVACLVHERTGLPYCVTPRWADLVAAADAGRDELAIVLREARHVVLFDEEMRRAVEAAFPGRAGESPLRLRLLRRGVDLEAFKPLPRLERRSAAARLASRPDLASRLQGIEWERACIVVCLQHDGDTDGFEQLLFALPEVLRQQPALVALVAAFAEPAPAVDQLRAALAARSPDLLHAVLQSNELYQPLLDHLDLLHVEGRSEAWWQQAARLEPERRVRFLGDVARDEFATLVALADFVVLPGVDPRRSTHVAFEALAGGVLPLVREATAAASVARLIADEISAEIASLCVLRAEAPAVREIEEKLGRMVRLRPELGDRLRALAVRKFDGRQTAADLRRLYGERAVAARA
jgi:glycosyltransferase involved in cell wall biosynthesis